MRPLIIDSFAGGCASEGTWADYRPNSSSASHSSSGAARPPRSITTCRKLTSSDAPGFGIDIVLPIARTIPRNSKEPNLILTAAPWREEQPRSVVFSAILDQRELGPRRSMPNTAMLNER